jgi:3-oxoadipate enol-lactonase
MPIVKANGINIYYEIHGKGEPLVLIAGYGSNSKSWFCQTPILSREYRVIIFDNRGAGRSDKPDYPYTMEMMADDVAGLLNAIGVKNAHILGISMGGAIAQEFAIRYPEKTLSLILGCTSCGGTHSKATDPTVRATLLSMGQLTPEESAKVLLPIVYTEEFIVSHKDIIAEQMKERFEYPTPAHGYANQAQAVMGHDTYDRLPQIKAPTLVIAGSADKLGHVENAEMMSSRIPNAELVILEKMGHGFCVEAAEKTNSIILDFLKRYWLPTKV